MLSTRTSVLDLMRSREVKSEVWLITTSDGAQGVDAYFSILTSITLQFYYFDYELHKRTSNNIILITCIYAIKNIVLFLVSWSEVRLSPIGTSATNWPIVSAPDDR
jgi:hypothetical protein